MAEAKDAALGYYGDATAVAGKAAADLKANAIDPATPEPPPTALEAAQNAVTSLESEQALSEIGQSSRSADQIKSGLIAAHQAVIDQGKRDLNDSDPSNDASAYSAITSSANAIQSLNETGSTGTDGGAGGAASAVNEYMTLASSRGDLFKSFGSNFAMAGNFGAASRALRGGGMVGAFGHNPGGAGMIPAGGGGIVFNQNFQQMPDPHTWSQGVAFELQAAL
jgi:hypothetical protein